MLFSDSFGCWIVYLSPANTQSSAWVSFHCFTRSHCKTFQRGNFTIFKEVGDSMKTYGTTLMSFLTDPRHVFPFSFNSILVLSQAKNVTDPFLYWIDWRWMKLLLIFWSMWRPREQLCTFWHVSSRTFFSATYCILSTLIPAVVNIDKRGCALLQMVVSMAADIF